MNVLIAGATGKTGVRLVHELISRGDSPIALVRESSDTRDLPSGVELRRGNLAEELPDDICEGCDAVVFAAGSGSSTGEEMTDAVDRKGARRLIDAAQRAGVRRFVMLSSIGAGDPADEGEMASYLQAKHDADEYLKASGLTYAIVRPVQLTEEDGAGDIQLGDEVDPEATAARGDVAVVLADALSDANWSDSVKRMQTA